MLAGCGASSTKKGRGPSGPPQVGYVVLQATSVPITTELAGRTTAWTALGGWIWLGARIIYLPLYAAGVPVVRTVAFAISLAGLGMVLAPLLLG